MKTLVTGDFVLDTHIVRGTRLHTSSGSDNPGTEVKKLIGGAYLTFEFLNKIFQFEKKKTKAILKKYAEAIVTSKSKDEKEKIKKNIRLLEDRLTIEIKHNLIQEKFKKFIIAHKDLNSYIEWQKPEGKDRWNLQALGYGPLAKDNLNRLTYLKNEYLASDVIIIDEANLGFREIDLNIENKTVILKMAYPFCEGKLWEKLSGGGNTLFTIVTLENLRRYDVKVSKAISWEQTALDLCFEITQNDKLKELLKTSYLVVLIGSAGALCIKTDEKKENISFELVFDPNWMEDEWEQKYGTSIGAGSAFTAGFSDKFLLAWHKHKYEHNQNQPFRPGMYDLISAGLNHVRIISKTGLVYTDENGHLQFYPTEKFNIAGKDQPHYFSYAFVPSPYRHAETKLEKKSERDKNEPIGSINYLKNSKWTILENNYFKTEKEKLPEPYFSLARDIAMHGPSMAQYAPLIKFGSFVSLDRSEIESLRNIKQLILDHNENQNADRPLNIAIFGPPGAGKSFAVKQLAKVLFEKDKIEFLEFNLSQFDHPSQLTGAYHSIRDAVLNGKFPFAFWDEFDSDNLSWLAHLIAPMQDGKFLENGVLHPLGKCIFIFAGATSYKMEAFNPEFYLLAEKELKTEKDKKAEKEKQEFILKDFRMKKGPDFLSRIHGFLDVQGPNRRLVYDRLTHKWVEDESDVCFPVRRALFLRGVLGLKDGEKLKMDWGLASAFLELSKYLKGSRSMERLLSQLTLKNKETIIRSNLPSDEIITMNVDYTDFMQKLYQDRKMEEFSEKLAVHIHNTWMEFQVTESNFYNEFKKLNYNGRKDNIAAAKRIPEVVGLTNMFRIEMKSSGKKDASEKFKKYIEIPKGLNVNDNLEQMAEKEHNSWLAERENDGWKTDEKDATNRNDYLRFHPCMKPYNNISENEKEKDRKTICKYIDFLAGSDFMIVEA